MRFNRRRAGAFIFLSIRTRGSFTVILQIPATGCQKSRWRCFYMLLLRPEPATGSAFPMSVTDWRSSIRKKMALRLSVNGDMELILCSVSRQGGVIAELSDCYYYICNQIVFNTKQLPITDSHLKSRDQNEIHMHLWTKKCYYRNWKNHGKTQYWEIIRMLILLLLLRR